MINKSGGSSDWINETDYATENSKDVAPDTCSERACTDEGPITAINALAAITEDWINIPKRSYTYSGLAKDGTTRIYEDITRNMRTRMITYDEVKAIIDVNGTIPEYMYGEYWTSTASGSSTAWIVEGPYHCASEFCPYVLSTSFDVCYDDNMLYNWYYSIYPVITLSK